MLCIVVGSGAACIALPVVADRTSIAHGEDSVELAGKCGVDLIPGAGRTTFDDLVWVATKAYGAGREGLSASATAKTPFV